MVMIESIGWNFAWHLYTLFLSYILFGDETISMIPNDGLIIARFSKCIVTLE